MLAHEVDAHAVLFRVRLFAERLDHVFVHYDAKAPSGARAALAAGLADVANATLIDERIDVHWGGDDMVEAMLALLAASAETGFGHYAFLSTSHIPLRSRDTYRSLAEEQAGRSATGIKPMPPKVVAKRLVAPFDKTRSKTIPAPGSAVRNLGQLARLLARYGWPQWGSQWSVLAHADVERVLAERDRVAGGSYRSWKILDEVLIPTMLQSDLDNADRTYASFPADNRGNPRWLDEAECREMIAEPGPYWFARKVHHDIARALFEAPGTDKEKPA